MVRTVLKIVDTAGMMGHNKAVMLTLGPVVLEGAPKATRCQIVRNLVRPPRRESTAKLRVDSVLITAFVTDKVVSVQKAVPLVTVDCGVTKPVRDVRVRLTVAQIAMAHMDSA